VFDFSYFSIFGVGLAIYMSYMIKGVLIFILGLFSVTALAEPMAQIYLTPYYPQYQEGNEAPLLEAALQKDLVLFAERRERFQKIWSEYAPNDPGLIEKDTFVLRRVLDRSANRIFKSDFFRKSRVGKAADSVKEKMETDIEFQDSKNMNHRFDLKVAAFQGQLFLQYSGITKAQLRYDMNRGGQLAMIFQHDLGTQSSIGIETTLSGENKTQMVNLQYVW
jgi:hypothetical protein